MFQIETGDCHNMYFQRLKLGGLTVFYSATSADTVPFGFTINGKPEIRWSFNGIYCADKTEAVDHVNRALVRFLTETTDSARALVERVTLETIEPMTEGRSLSDEFDTDEERDRAWLKNSCRYYRVYHRLAMLTAESVAKQNFDETTRTTMVKSIERFLRREYLAELRVTCSSADKHRIYVAIPCNDGDAPSDLPSGYTPERRAAHAHLRRILTSAFGYSKFEMCIAEF
jgi:hypothetical protein